MQQLAGRRRVKNSQLVVSMTVPQPCIHVTSHIPLMTIGGDFISILRKVLRWQQVCRQLHRGFPTCFPQHSNVEKVWKIALLHMSSGSAYHAIQTIILICMCRTLEVVPWIVIQSTPVRIPWGKICAPWDVDVPSWGREGSTTVWIMPWSFLEEWACRDFGLWPPDTSWKGLIKLRKRQVALDVLSLPLLTVNLTIPNWLATGGTWV